MPVNVVDDPELSTFIFPAIIDRSPVIVAVGSSGHSPVLARRVREQIEALLPARLGALARFVGDRRKDVQQRARGAESGGRSGSASSAASSARACWQAMKPMPSEAFDASCALRSSPRRRRATARRSARCI